MDGCFALEVLLIGSSITHDVFAVDVVVVVVVVVDVVVVVVVVWTKEFYKIFSQTKSRYFIMSL